MTFTIGRASFTNAPSAIRHNGDRVDIDIDIRPTSLVAAKVLRQQVLGLANNDDEPVVPLTWSDDADYDGFYRVLGVDVEPVQAYLTNRLMRARLSLERVGGGYANPVHELYAIGVDASTGNLPDPSSPTGFGGSVTASAAVYLPSSHVIIDDRATATTRDVEDGTTINELTVALDDSESTTIGVSHLMDVDEFYDAACVIEESISGTWYKVVGRQVKQGATLRVQNGIVRVSVATTGVVTVEHWDGAAWRSKSYTITYNTGSGTISDFNAVRVYRNGPDAVTIRYTGVTSADEACHIDVSVQRGHNVAEFTLSTYSDQTWKIARTTTEAGTVVTDAGSNAIGMRATSNDANGDRYVLVSRWNLLSTDTTNGSISIAAAAPPVGTAFKTSTGVPFGIGYEVNGSSATGANTAGALMARYQIAMFLERTVST